jgi:hypothetical protein
MGLETGARIEDLDADWPIGSQDPVSQGDDHLRLIKFCVQGSFPSLGPGQCLRTTVELNDVKNKLISFNGRTDVAALPTAGDYSTAMLSDVDSADPVENDILIWTDAGGGEYRPAAQQSILGEAGGHLASSLLSNRPSSYAFGVQINNSLQTSLGSLATYGPAATLGALLTADAKVMCTFTVTIPDIDGTNDDKWALVLNGSPGNDVDNQSAANLLAVANTTQTSADPLVLTWSGVLDISDKVWVCANTQGSTQPDARVSVSVLAVA